jgi:chemotaxis protein MotA
MDPITIIGLTIALATTFLASFMSGMNPIVIFFSSPSSIILVVGGAIGATAASGTMDQFIAFPKGLIKAFMGGPGEDPAITIKLMVDFADVARKEGLLALEERFDEINDPFFRNGLELAVDGTDPDELREMLELDVFKMQGRHKSGAAFYATCAGYGPAFGMVGTVIGLVDMLGKLDDPSTLGPSMAVAFLTTLWGAFIANYFFTPISSRLRKLSELEVASRELMIEGILAIQAGSNPRNVAGKLVSFLPPSRREEILGEKSA